MIWLLILCLISFLLVKPWRKDSITWSRSSQLRRYAELKARESRRKKHLNLTCQKGGGLHEYGDWTAELLGIKARWCIHCTSEETKSSNMKVDYVKEGIN